MTKRKIERSSRTEKIKKSFFNSFNLNEFLPQKYHIPVIILIILILFLVFLNPLYFGNKTFQSGDIISSEAMKPYVENHKGGYTLWNPLIFCGMPAYATAVETKWFNLIAMAVRIVRDLFTGFFSVEYTMWTFYMILLGITTFLLVKYISKSTLIGLFSAIACSFSTGIIVFLYIGHVTKLNCLCMFPLIFLMLLKFQEKIRFIDFLILIIALQIFLLGFHVQIIFYTLFAVAIYFIYYFLRSSALKDSRLRISILKSAGVFAAASIIALLIQIDNISQIYEYTPYSTRGTESILDKTSAKTEKTESNYYAYHTDWSFSPEEISTFFIPSFYGFGNSTYKGPLSNNQPVEVNTYFGQMSYVDVAVGYMGILIFMLALFGIFTKWKDPFVRFLSILAFLALLISFGKNFPVIFNILFYYLPSFNKFRVPSMILVLVQVSIPILAAYGIMGIMSAREENNIKRRKTVKNLSIAFTILFVAAILFNGSLSSWFTARVNEHAQAISASQQQLARQFQVLAEYMSQMFINDLLFGLGFLALAGWAAYGYINKNLSIDVLLLLFIVLTVIDLWRIDARGAKYSEPLSKENFFIEPEYIKIIRAKEDKGPYRILNLKQDSSPGSFGNNNANFNAYFLIEDFYGYSGIKPRAYQDIIDIMGPVNATAWKMLNVKYIITGNPIPGNQFPYLKQISAAGNTFVYENSNALPRVYFVNKVEQKKAIEILNSMKGNLFDPRDIAYLEDEKIAADSTDSTVSVQIKNYSDENIEIDAAAAGDNFLFVGNTFTKGWKGFIDGKETKIYKANHGFLGLIVPKGMHKVLISYSPTSFYISKYTVFILSSLVMLGLLLVLFNHLRQMKKVKS